MKIDCKSSSKDERNQEGKEQGSKKEGDVFENVFFSYFVGV